MASAGPYASLQLLQTDNHASTPPLSFLQAGCPSFRPTNSVKALKAQEVKVVWQKSHSDERTNHAIVYNEKTFSLTHTYNHLMPFVHDCQGGPVAQCRKETFTHSHPSWSSDILYQLPSSTMIYAQFAAWQSFSTTSLQVLFGLPLGLGPSTSYSIHFCTQSSIHHLF